MPDLINEVVVAVLPFCCKSFLTSVASDCDLCFLVCDKMNAILREKLFILEKALDTFLDVHYLLFQKKERKEGKEPPYPSAADIYMTLSRNTCNPVKSHLMSSQHRIGMPHRELYASFQ
ncbi:hypothetical protein CDAR_448171 [Caerostris darwini]|uniref:Uncharacterized protein n=1 Tax=Caerostris darwini TaxID=1538125 RepID=A0AAV4SEY8_9ARAC|nr:hypothetical protein CDAR_448171 [Caerostris darwini]